MKKALGKGLSALIPDTYKDDLEKVGVASESAGSQEAFRLVTIDKVDPNPDQPRKEFDQDRIEELSKSIQEHGILQPIIVARKDDRYEIVCGERRFRAAKHSGLSEVPVVVKELAAHEFLEWAILENVQRQDLNPLEEAEAYKRLADERLISHEEIAKRLGKSRVAITNSLRLLKLPEDIRHLIASELITAGHARALLGLMTPEHQRQMAKRIAEDKLSVRQVEEIVNRSNAHKRKAKKARHINSDILDLETRLTQHLGTQVKIYPRKDQKRGRMEIQYYSLDDLDRVLEKVGLPQN